MYCSNQCQQAINNLLSLKNELNAQKDDSNSNSKIYGSGKHLIDYVAEDFNEPLDMFTNYQKWTT